MKTNKITQLFIAFCLTLITLSANAQTSQVVYNNPEHTSGSLTLSAADCSSGWWYYDWEIIVPTNTPIKITTQLNYEVFVEVFSYINGVYQTAFQGDDPGTSTNTIIGANGSIYVYCEDYYGIIPSSNVFTINFEIDSAIYSQTNNLYIPGQLSINSGLDVFGNASIAGNTRINSRLGIGTSAYDSKLHVYNYNQDNRALYLNSSKSTTSSLYGLYSSASNGTGNVYGVYSTVSGVSGKKWAGYFNGGDVAIMGGKTGIGSISPTEKLTVAGGHSDTKIRLHSTGNGSDQPANLSLWASEPGLTYFGTGIGYNVNGSPYYGRIDNTRGSSYIRFLPGETKFQFQNTSGINIEVLNLYESGKVGIGTSAIPSDFKLAVAGKIIAEEVVVKLQSAWPDYVFHQDYRLKPLHEVEQFVKANKHLPGIPSAAQVEEKGLSMGEMQNKLLQKVEELTLYIIEQQKQIDQQNEKIRLLENR